MYVNNGNIYVDVTIYMLTCQKYDGATSFTYMAQWYDYDDMISNCLRIMSHMYFFSIRVTYILLINNDLYILDALDRNDLKMTQKYDRIDYFKMFMIYLQKINKILEFIV